MGRVDLAVTIALVLFALVASLFGISRPSAANDAIRFVPQLELTDLSHGTVAYGNIGSGDRLDFTVIGRDVNLTSRIERLCRELGQQLIMSGEFVARLQEPMFEIGHFALRGVPQMQLLFGLPPAP